jgi:hypothetical protein
LGVSPIFFPFPFSTPDPSSTLIQHWSPSHDYCPRHHGCLSMIRREELHRARRLLIPQPQAMSATLPPGLHHRQVVHRRSCGRNRPPCAPPKHTLQLSGIELTIFSRGALVFQRVTYSNKFILCSLS